MLRRPLCASQRLRSGRGGSAHTVPSGSLNPQMSRREGERLTEDSSCDSSHVGKMPLYVELRLGPSGREFPAPAWFISAHSRLLAMRSSDVRNQELNDKLPRLFGSGDDRDGTEAGAMENGKQEDDVGSGPGKIGDSGA